MIFRYPGGKSRLLLEIQGFVDAMSFKDGDPFHDVFVGGGSVLLHMAKNYPNSELYANDTDPWMRSFWRVVAGPRRDFNELMDRVRIKPTVEMFLELRGTEAEDHIGEAFRAVFFNRTSFSGILTSGPIGGYGQKSAWGIGCRYNASALVSDMLYMREALRLGDRLIATDEDATSYVAGTGDFMYLDPPYVGQGDALYRKGVDHAALAVSLRNKGRWVLTYDDCPLVRELYSGNDIHEIPARYSIRDHKKTWVGKKELFITPESTKAPWREDLIET